MFITSYCYFTFTIILSALLSLHTLSFCSALTESESLSNLLCKDARPAVFHGGSIPRGHANMDGCHSNRRWGLHTVYDLRDSGANTQLWQSKTGQALSNRTSSLWEEWNFQWYLNLRHAASAHTDWWVSSRCVRFFLWLHVLLVHRLNRCSKQTSHQEGLFYN